MESPEHQRRHVIRYFEMEHGDARVELAEKVASERIYGEPHDVWDIRSTDGRWWVITNLTNLYRQDDFPSLDYVLSFHIGLMMRLRAGDARKAPVDDDEERTLLSVTWRKFEQAAEALNEADEAEEFQAVGVRCREVLLSFVREASRDDMIPAGAEPPKLGDFVHWSEYIAGTVASGASAAAYRSFLKRTAKATWDLANWLTHAGGATRFDGEAVVSATGHVLAAFSDALHRHERGIPDRCPSCSSYRLEGDYREEADASVTVCCACGWESEPRYYDMTPARS